MMKNIWSVEMGFLSLSEENWGIFILAEIVARQQ